ncbi:palmitoleoyl-protein carboxylesterase NOTUM [Teleopsis dalmanni]|uniref:palmitoleoyl-protein carboxylesterase NOTUM n=1 Tax=Teleopsis dalmanni TaxID=139649 RepID=UPI0018CC80E0|nr:palmitoleoyl-protein carboxylesterase NOTUM [Teleopsis dalmanni]
MRQKLAIETNSLQRPGVEANQMQDKNSRSLKRVFLSNRTITCNDGSQAGFYLRKNPQSKKWIVFLEGGWHCYDTRSCRARWLRLRHLMTSAQWTETRDVGGILSPLAEENPYWHSANHVLVPYCSSDSWSGTRAIAESPERNWRFMGALILRQVIADLIPLGLGRTAGAELLLVGSSAGGLGVMLNLDRITRYLQQERNLFVTVRGVSDSGWFLDREPYTPSAVASSEAVRQGWKLWQGLLPEECMKVHTAEPWRCYFGYRLYPTLKSPLFVFQWLFDEAQMRADNVGAPVTPQQWNYIHEMGAALRSSLDNVTAVFAPSCIGHAVLSKRDWINIRLDDISLPSALRCWEHSTRPRRRRHDKLGRSTEATLTPNKKHRHPNNQREEKNEHNKNRQNNLEHPKRHQKHLTKEQRAERRRLRLQKQAQRREQRERHNRKQNNAGVARKSDRENKLPKRPHDINGTNVHERKQHKERRRNHDTRENAQKPRQGNKRRRKEQKLQREKEKERDLQQQQEQILTKAQKDHSINRTKRVSRVPEKCIPRLLERCSWPQCNHSCPTLTNPLTGEEMRFLELLTSFGLDIEAVAAALGVDMHTLNNMDRTELVNLLTQQVS